jgi:hypothetical protein
MSLMPDASSSLADKQDRATEDRCAPKRLRTFPRGGRQAALDHEAGKADTARHGPHTNLPTYLGRNALRTSSTSEGPFLN